MSSNRFTNPNRRFNGLHFDDPWKEFISGHARREEATKDGTQLFSEVYHYRDDLFPVRSVPVESHPGYVTHDQNFFRIVTKGEKTSQLLTDYFSEEHSHRNDSISFGGAHDLGGLFEFILQGLLVDGISYYAVEWGEVKLDTKTFVLPRAFMYVNPSTVKIVDEANLYAIQNFSWIAKLMNDYFEYQQNTFQKEELFTIKHPVLYPSSPVGIAIQNLKELRSWLSFSLWQGKGSAEPTNHTLKVERTRYQHSDDLLRKQSLSRLKVKRLFKQAIGGQGVALTTYYEVFAYAEYRKQLNMFRRYLVDEFNKQVLSWVQSKNNIKSPVLLEFRGFTSNEVIDDAFIAFSKREVDVDGFVKAIKDDYDRKLF